MQSSHNSSPSSASWTHERSDWAYHTCDIGSKPCPLLLGFFPWRAFFFSSEGPGPPSLLDLPDLGWFSYLLVLLSYFVLDMILDEIDTALNLGRSPFFRTFYLKIQPQIISPHKKNTCALARDAYVPNLISQKVNSGKSAFSAYRNRGWTSFP